MKYSAQQYAQALFEMLETAPKNSHEIVRNVAETLLKNGQAGLVRSIAMQFKEISNAHKGITSVEVTVVEKNAVEIQKLEKLLGTKVELVEKIDPSVRAGARIKIGDYQIDNTLARRLSDLRNILTQ